LKRLVTVLVIDVRDEVELMNLVYVTV